MMGGLEVWDDDDNLILTTTTRVMQVRGVVTTTAVNGSVLVPSLPAGEVFYFSRPTFVSTNANSQPVHPVISYSNGRIYWQFPEIPHWPNATFTKIPAVVHYGVF